LADAEYSNPELIGTYDIIYIERIAFDKKNQIGTHPTRFIREAHLLLKTGGILVISTGWHKHPEATLPGKDSYDARIASIGFGLVVSERDKITTAEYPTSLAGYNGMVTASSQNITYYAIKTTELAASRPKILDKASI